MSVRIAWSPVTESSTASYDIERSLSISGPWVFLVNIPHNTSDVSIYDVDANEFFYVDQSGSSAFFYRLISINDQAQRSAPSEPFGSSPNITTPYSASLVSDVVIPVGNVEALLALGYSTIEVWKSVDYGNSYSEITSSTEQAAKLSAALPNSRYYLKDAILSFLIDGAQSPSVSFGSALDYYSSAQVVSKINTTIPGIASIGSSGEVVVSSTRTGSASSIQISQNTLAASLGFPTTRAVGTDRRIPLVSGQVVYFLYDVNPIARSKYKWRYSANGASPVSSFSNPVTDSLLRLGVSPTELTVGVALFITASGMANKTSLIISSNSIQKIGNSIISPASTIVVEADSTGFLQVPLLRGSKMVVAVEGTSIVREITVPDLPVFDIMQAVSDIPDQFTVQEVAPLLTRRSL